MNCKPGDLAIVVGATYTLALNGRIVEVIRPAVAGAIYAGKYRDEGGMRAWVCRSAANTPLPWKLFSGNTAYLAERPIADSALRPIRPGDLDETIDTDVKKPDEVAA
jgi:hypothetical protein